MRRRFKSEMNEDIELTKDTGTVSAAKTSDTQVGLRSRMNLNLESCVSS